MKIDDLLNRELNWKPILKSERDFLCEEIEKSECFLRMNNFPEEPLWTLFCSGENINFDDTPKKWKITYRSKE